MTKEDCCGNSQHNPCHVLMLLFYIDFLISWRLTQATMSNNLTFCCSARPDLSDTVA